MRKKNKAYVGFGIKKSTNKLMILFKVPKRFSRRKYIIHKFYFGPEKACEMLKEMKKYVDEVIENDIKES